MGRRTFESAELGSVALPSRRNVVLSRDTTYLAPAGVVHASDWEEALMLADGGFGGGGYDDGAEMREMEGEEDHRVFVIGGEEVYRAALDGGRVGWVYATEVEGEWEGDRFFQQLGEGWRRIGGGDGGLKKDLCRVGWAGDGWMWEKGVKFRHVTFEKDWILPWSKAKGEKGS